MMIWLPLVLTWVSVIIAIVTVKRATRYTLRRIGQARQAAHDEMRDLMWQAAALGNVLKDRQNDLIAINKMVHLLVEALDASDDDKDLPPPPGQAGPLLPGWTEGIEGGLHDL